MKTKNNFLIRYLIQAPVFLAMERAIECRLIAKIKLKRPILDLGCGDGIFSSTLFAEPLDLGVDISLNEIMMALKRKTYKNVIIGNISILPLKEKSFNSIICNSVMEHVLDLKKAIKSTYTVLSPGGKFILTVPTEHYDEFLFYPALLHKIGFKNLAKRYQDTVNKTFKHHHAYPVKEWINIIKENGFKVTDTIHYCHKKVMATDDFYLPFSCLSLMSKKLFKRWILWPGLRKYSAKILELFLRKYYLYDDSTEGACILIEATRV